jgi:hypothetical protein
MSELSFKDEAASAYDRAVAHVSTHFLPFLLRAARLEPGQRVLDAATKEDGRDCSAPGHRD